MARDDFDPFVYTVEQRDEPFGKAIVTELIRDALKSCKPSLLGALIDPETGAPIFPNLARRNSSLVEGV